MGSRIVFWRNVRSVIVTLADMATVATGTVFYRKTAGTGVPEVQTLATLKTDLGLTGTNSGDQNIITTIGATGTDINLDGNTLHVPSASATNRGVITTGAQTLAGKKTLSQFEMVGLSDVVMMEITPFASQTNHLQIWRSTVGNLATSWIDATGNIVFGRGSFTFSTTFHGIMWNGGAYGWSNSGAVTSGSSLETGLFRDGAAGVIAARNGTQSHDLRVYNTHTNASNYERGNIGFVSNVYTIGSFAAGTGTLRDIHVGVAGNKIGFYGTTAIAKPTTGFAAATFTANAGTAVNDASTFDGYTLNQVVAALRAFGLLT